MKPIYFQEYNKVYSKNQRSYLPLPVYEDNIQGGRVFHCWSLSWKERFKILFTGQLWINVLNFEKPLQPIKPMIDCPFNRRFGNKYGEH